jgi:hypothetical protein
MLSKLTTRLTPSPDGLLIQWLVALLGTNWKTSLNGILALIIGTIGVLSSFVASLGVLLATQNFKNGAFWSFMIAILGLVLTTVAGVCRAWVGFIQLDTGVIAAQVQVKDPSTGTVSTEEVAVASHEVPFDKTAQPIPPH